MMDSKDVEPIGQPKLTMIRIFRTLWRHKLLIIAVTIAGASLGLVFLWSVEPQYRAEAIVLLDTRRHQVTNFESILSSPVVVADATLIRTQVEILQSESIARRVIEAMDLLSRPEFQPGAGFRSRLEDSIWEGVRLFGLEDLVTRAGRWFGDRNISETGVSSVSGADKKLAIAVARYEERLKIANDIRSYIIKVQFEATNPLLAMQIVNEHVAIYLADELKLKSGAIRSASAYLADQVAELEQKLRRSETAVEQYRQQNGIVSTKGINVVGQQLSELNSQLTVARSDLAQKEARLAQIRAAAPGNVAVEHDKEVLSSPLIGRLREQEAILARRLAELSARFGDQHPTMIDIRAELSDLRQNITGEIAKIIKSATLDVDVARARGAELRHLIADQERRSLAIDAAEIRLRELMREADSNRSLYEHLLGRYKEVTAQEGIQQAEARIVSSASVPYVPFFPRKHLVLSIASALSFLFGCSISILMDRLRRSEAGVFGVSELEAVITVPVLGSVPAISRPVQKVIPPHELPTHYPKSNLAEAINSIRFAAEKAALSNGLRIWLIASALPGEGKSSIALLLARSLSSSGLKVLLIDADLRKPSIAYLVYGRRHVGTGLLGCLSSAECIETSVSIDTKTPLELLLPEAIPERPQDLLAPARMHSLIEKCRKRYEYVIIDSPPVSAVYDAMLLSEVVDRTIFIVRWNKTPLEVVKSAVKRMVKNNIHIAGIVLNAVDVKRAELCPGDFDAYYAHNKQYYEDHLSNGERLLSGRLLERRKQRQGIESVREV